VRGRVPPIELVDREKLLDIFEKFELELQPQKTYNIDKKFFDGFQ
jgi:restriction system protein